MLLHYIKSGAYTTIMFTASSVMVRVLSFFTLPYFVANLTLAEFGIWDFYQLFFSWGTLLLSSCAAAAVTRYTALYHGDAMRQQQALGTALWAAAVGSCVFALIGLGALIVAGRTHADAFCAYATVVNIALFAPFSVLLAYVRIRQQLWHYFMLFCGQSVLALALTVVGVYYGFGIAAFFYANGISYLVFIPYFCGVLVQYRCWSWSALNEQLRYSLPLLVANIMYTGFFTVDRVCIKYGAGYEVLGQYALLWRFGAMFQVGALALYDAWMIMILNAHNQQEGDFLVNRLTTYATIVLTTLSLAACVIARGAIGYLFQGQHHYLILFLPLFFAGLAVLETARLLGAGSVVALKTNVLPLITIGAVAVQVLLIVVWGDLHVWGVLLGNLCAFMLYAGVRYWYGTTHYSASIIDVQRIVRVVVMFLWYCACYHVLFMYSVAWYWLAFVSATWPVAVWVMIIDEREKAWVLTRLKWQLMYEQKN